MRVRIIREGEDMNHLVVGNYSLWLTDREMVDVSHDIKQYIFDNRFDFLK
jgi:hypothetical protein